MQFRTPIDLPVFSPQLQASQKSMFIGSCFAEHIAQKFREHALPHILNPFGIVYNPKSVAQALQLLLTKREFDKTDIFRHQELWHSFHFHGRFSAPKANDALRAMNRSVAEAATQLTQTDFLFITFGTAYYFTHNETGVVVANNHKMPASEFTRHRMQVYEITALFATVLTDLFRVSPNLRVVFTVSPVRHLKDGLHGNQLSKATLLLAIDALAEQFSQVLYFPAYEILNDDLRDYRFYANDMAHPSELAVEYVWEQFCEACLAPEAKQVMKQTSEIYKAMQHRVLFPVADAHQKFKEKDHHKAMALWQEFPFLSLDDALDYFA